MPDAPIKTTLHVIAAGLIAGPWLVVIWVSLFGGTVSYSSKGFIPQLEQLIRMILRR